MQSNYTKSELFSLMNKLKKEKNITQKQAFALAKAKLENNCVEESIADKLIALMRKGNVKFTFINRGKEITTTGHMCMQRIPNGRTIQGRQTPRTPNHIVFYDVRHGVYRQFEKSSVISYTH